MGNAGSGGIINGQVVSSKQCRQACRKGCALGGVYVSKSSARHIATHGGYIGGKFISVDQAKAMGFDRPYKKVAVSTNNGRMKKSTIDV